MNVQPHERIVRLSEVTMMLGLSRSTIYDKLNTRSRRYDASFPKPLKLGQSAIGWPLSAISMWIDTRSTNVKGERHVEV